MNLIDILCHYSNFLKPFKIFYNFVLVSAPTGPFKATEGENIRLPCVTSGTPTPTTTWQRLDGRPIDRGPWQGE